jgi:mxaD protein
MANVARLLWLLAALSGFTQGALAADAPELKVEHSILIDATPEEVWAVAGDFNGIQRWLTTIAESRMILGKSGQVGAIRELTRQNGTKVQEKLLEYETGDEKILTYTYVGGTVIATDYFATMIVSDAGNGKSKVVWKARFKRLAYWTDNPPEGQDDATPLNALNKTYPLGLGNLKKVVEGEQ